MSLFVPSRGISNLNLMNSKERVISTSLFVPSRGISNLNSNINIYYHNLKFLFVPSRGISNLNPVFYIALESRLPNMVCGRNRKPCITSLYNHLLLSAIPYFQGIGAKWHINYEFCMLIRPIPISYSSPLYLVHLHTCGAKCSCRFL